MGTALFAWTSLSVAVGVLERLIFAVALDDPQDQLHQAVERGVLFLIAFELAVHWVWSTGSVGSAAIWFVMRKEQEMNQ